MPNDHPADTTPSESKPKKSQSASSRKPKTDGYQPHLCELCQGSDESPADYRARCRHCYLCDIEPFLVRSDGSKVLQSPQARSNIEYHKKLLEHIWRELIRLPRVAAVDVGFIYSERLDRYLPEVGIRLHFEEPEEVSCNGSPWLGLPQRIFQRVLQLMVAPHGQDEEIKIFDKSEFSPTGREGKLHLPSRSKSGRIEVPSCEFYLKVPGVPAWIPDLEPSRSQLPKNFYVDFVNACYQPASNHIQTGPPLPNTRGFSDEQVRRIGIEKVEPLAGGISIGNAAGSAGTLGAVVWDATDGKPVILGNWHVLGGAAGSRVGDPVYQPGLLEGGDPAEDQVGTLKRWTFDRHADAALAAIEPGIDYAPGEILGLWLPIWDAIRPQLGMQVRKWGRGSGFSKGFIDGVAMRVKVEYSNVGIRLYENQYRIAPICSGGEVSAQGDSGSLWVAKAEVPWNLLQDLMELCEDDAELADHFHGKRDVSLAELSDHKHDGADLPLRQADRDLRLLSPEQKKNRKLRVYFGVCLQFAGDVPGSTLREHAVASSLVDVAKRLRFSFRPLFQDPAELVPQPRPRRRLPRSEGGGAAAGRPTSQISTDEGRRSVGPQPTPDPLDGHP